MRRMRRPVNFSSSFSSLGSINLYWFTSGILNQGKYRCCSKPKPGGPPPKSMAHWGVLCFIIRGRWHRCVSILKNLNDISWRRWSKDPATSRALEHQAGERFAMYSWSKLLKKVRQFPKKFHIPIFLLARKRSLLNTVLFWVHKLLWSLAVTPFFPP